MATTADPKCPKCNTPLRGWECLAICGVPQMPPGEFEGLAPKEETKK